VKRTYGFLLGVLLSASCVAAVASAQGGQPTANTSRVAKVGLRRTSVGTILVSASGRTLYEFTRDRAHSNSCVKISGCSEIWPALTTSGQPTAGPGVRASLLSTIKLPGGAKQVTYAVTRSTSTAATADREKPPTLGKKRSVATGTRSTPRDEPSSSRPGANGDRSPTLSGGCTVGI